FQYAHPCIITRSHKNGERYWDYGSSVYRYREENVVDTETYIKHFLAKIGTVVVEVPVDRSFFFYKSGLYSPNCESIIGYQPALLIGYGMKNGQKVWILRNSFGLSWGNNGDFEMQIESKCGFGYAFTLYD
ncbi:hypothetical protein PMAYCL1PPCAC_05651, partial [Pristionchus mayeri]